MRFHLGAFEERVCRRVAELAATDAASRIWRRDSNLWSDDVAAREVIANRLGWLDAPETMRAHVGEIEGFAQRLRRHEFTDIVLLGMGGSSLAPEVLRTSVLGAHGAPRLRVLDTTVPATIAATEACIDPRTTLFVVSSKSGTTIEALTLYDWAWSLTSTVVQDRVREHFVAITDAGSPLEALARERAFAHIFLNPPDIGGRYSALSYFGLAPAAAAGIDVGRLLDAAAGAAQATRSTESSALRLGAALGELALAGRNKLTFLLTPGAASFGLWVEQLLAESLGKDGRGIVPVVGEPLGSPRVYGDDRVFLYLRLEGDSAGEMDAVVGALAAEGHPILTVDLDTTYDFGREFFRWEFAVAVVGHVLGVNPFDEPNVRESKDNTSRALADLERTHDPAGDGFDDVGPNAIRACGPATGLVDRVAELLGSIRPHDYFATLAYLAQDAVTDAAFAEMRGDVREACRVATTVGYGPRYLHSTGQLHKGGPEQGVFLFVTAGVRHDVSIAGRRYSFGQLNRAQAIGDFQALAGRGRRALWVHLGRDVADGLEQLRQAIAKAAGTASPRRR